MVHQKRMTCRCGRKHDIKEQATVKCGCGRTITFAKGLATIHDKVKK